MRTHSAISLFLASCAGELHPRTVRQATGTLYRLPDIELDELSPDVLRNWRSELGLSPASANKYMDRVRAFLTWAELSGHVDRNVARLVRPLIEPSKQRLRLTQDQLARLLDVASNPRDRVALALSREWLLRASELTQLRVGHFNLDAMTADVRVMKKEGVYAWDEMVITPTLADEIDRWMDAYRSAAGEVRAEHFLLPAATYRRNGSHTVISYRPTAAVQHPEEIVKRALDAIGVDAERRGFHDIRRSMARLRYDALVKSNGENDAIAIVSSLLHHDSRRTTELYLGVEGDRERRNAAMRHPSWTRVTGATSTSASSEGSGLAKVIPITA